VNYLTIKYPLTASLLFEGAMYNHLQQVYLSSGNMQIPGTLSAIDLFSTNPLVSASFPPFSGYALPSTNYYFTDNNHLYVNLPSFDTSGTYDIILFNVAGYSKLSDHGYLISNQSTANAMLLINSEPITLINNPLAEILLIN